MTAVKHPDTVLSYIKSLEKRIATLEGQSRLSAARVPNGQLNVGPVGAANQIEINSAGQLINFTSAAGQSTLQAFGSGGAQLSSPSAIGSPFSWFTANGIVWNGPYFNTLQANKFEADGSSGHTSSQVYCDVQDSGNPKTRGTVALTAHSDTDADGSVISLQSSGGVTLYNENRTTDPPNPGAGAVTFYVKLNRLYYVDGTGVVRGPL